MIWEKLWKNKSQPPEKEPIWQDRFLSPQIEAEKYSLKKVKKIIKDFWVLLKHALSFHEKPQPPKEELPDFQSHDTETIYNICKDFFNNANSRIDSLEEKSLKLLTYVTALFAFISFAFLNSSVLVTKIMLIIGMVLLLFSILISFRCVNVKSRKTSFVPDVYDFKVDPPTDNFDKKSIAKKLLNSAIFNENVADNTADLLRSSRHMLALALVISVLGFLFGIHGYFNTSKVSSVEIANPINISHIESELSNTNQSLSEINSNIKALDNSLLKDQVAQLAEELQNLQSKYNDILQRIDELESEQ